MEIAIFDTSVWIDFFNGAETKGALLLEKYIQEASSSICLTPTILQELLQGLRTEKDFERVKSILQSFTILAPDWQNISVSAAKLYFDLRKKGVTIRKSTDCLIAATALQYDYLLVHNDTDFDLIAQNFPLRSLK